METVTGHLPPSALRFRVWIDGTLADETVIDTGEPNAKRLAGRASSRHQVLAAEAERDGRRWLIEIYDPAKPVLEAFTRFGTDRAGMVDPRELRC